MGPDSNNVEDPNEDKVEDKNKDFISIWKSKASVSMMLDRTKENYIYIEGTEIIRPQVITDKKPRGGKTKMAL